MSLLKLPEIRADAGMTGVQFDMRTDAVERWQPDVRAAETTDAHISIYEVIGADWDGSGVTARRIGAALRSIGQRDVTVSINSPGGDFFEGVAIYNLLREHPARVTVRVVGLAASAASVIAMAGDDILMGDGAFFMVHNAWAVAVGNRHDMKAAFDMLEPFDAAMADLYARRTGMKQEDVVKLMDAETWLGAKAALQDGFATGMLDDQQITHDTQASKRTKPLALIEASMAKAGYSRSARRDVLKAMFQGTPGATQAAMPSAGNQDAAQLQSLIDTLKG